jgi:hypothetical protein
MGMPPPTPSDASIDGTREISGSYNWRQFFFRGPRAGRLLGRFGQPF